MAEIEILGRQYGKDVFKRVVLEGYEAYQKSGPYRECPYGSDQRNGAWAFGARMASQNKSRSQAWREFCIQENY